MAKPEEKKDNNRKMSKPKLSLNLLLLTFILAIVAFLVIYLRQSNGDKVNITYGSIKHELEAIQELSTYVYNYSDFVLKTEDATIRGITVPGTKNTLIIVYSGKIKVGCDLSNVNCEIDETEKKIKLTLNSPKILDNYIDHDSIKTVEFNNPFNPIKVDNAVKYLSGEKEKHEEYAIKKEHVFKLAEEQAEDVIKKLFLAFHEYKVSFEWIDSE